MSIPGVEQSEIDRNMRKKHFIVFTMWFYVAGIEYGLVFSSINSYLQKLGAAPFYLGFALAAFPLSGLLLATLMGRFTDRMRKIRPTLLIGVSCSVLGNLLYFSIQNKNVTVVARFMCGIGNSIDGAVMGYSGLLNDSR
jgi:MFS family permease